MDNTKYVGNEDALRSILKEIIALQMKYGFSLEDNKKMEYCINELISFSYQNATAIEKYKNFS